MAENYYEILGVPVGAEKKEIKRAYFKLVRAYSPEKNPEKFQQIRKAYENLMSDDRVSVEVPADIPDIPLAKSMMLQIEKSMKIHDYEGAAAIAKEAVDYFGEKEVFLYYQGICCRYAGKTGKSVKCFERLVKLNPDKVLYNRELAITYWERGFGKKAFAAFEQAYAMGCRDDEFLNIFSLCCADREEPIRGTEILLELVGKEKHNLRDSMDEMLEAYMGLVIMNIAAEEGMIQRILSAFSQFTENASAYLKEYEQKVLEITAVLLMICYPRGGRLQAEAEELLNKLKSRISGKRMDELTKALMAEMMRTRMDNDDRLSETMKMGYEAFVDPLEGYDSQILHFMRLDVKLCMMEEWPSIRPELEIIKEEYPAYYEAIQSFVNRLERKERLDILKEQLLKDYNRLETSIRGGRYYEKYPERRSGFGEVKWDSYEEGTFVRQGKKVGRNDPCPCGSGKKYKNCCGRK